MLYYAFNKTMQWNSWCSPVQYQFENVLPKYAGFPSTNDTAEVIIFPDFPYSKDYEPGFHFSVNQVWNYLKDYADNFELHSHIQVARCLKERQIHI